MDGYSAIAPEEIAMFFQNYGIENNETYKELQKQRKELQKTVTKFKKASGNGEYNLIKYVRCHHHNVSTMCPAQILTTQPINTIF